MWQDLPKSCMLMLEQELPPSAGDASSCPFALTAVLAREDLQLLMGQMPDELLLLLEMLQEGKKIPAEAGWEF